MKNNLKTHTSILLYGSIISILGAAFILFQINSDITAALNVFQTQFDARHYFMALSHIFVFIFHLYAIVFIFVHLRLFSEYKPIAVILMISAVISLFSMGIEKIMIDEIAREYRHGLGINELGILNFAYLINLAFFMTMFVFLLRTRKAVKSESITNAAIDEEFFIIGHFLGLVSGISGLVFTLHMIQFVNKSLIMEKIWVLIPFYILFLTPYALAVFYWIFIKRKQKISDWYDEKQIQDMLKSSAASLLLSVPGLSILLLLQLPHNLFITIYFLFLILILFSAGTLYFYKVKEFF